jgi:hypothetical protein
LAIEVNARDKVGLLAELSSRAAWAAKFPNGVVINGIKRHDELRSTEIGRSAVSPDGRSRVVSKHLGCRFDSNSDFEAIDGQPVEMVCLLLLRGKMRANEPQKRYPINLQHTSACISPFGEIKARLPVIDGSRISSSRSGDRGRPDGDR